MKLYLSINGAPISNYLNLSPIQGDISLGQEWVCWSNFGDLSQFAEHGEVWEILADNIIDYFPLSDIAKVLEYWAKLLRHGGKLIVGGTDAGELSREFFLGNIPVQDLNKIVYGENARKSSLNYTVGIVELLESFGLVVDKKRINGTKFIIEAKRP